MSKVAKKFQGQTRIPVESCEFKWKIENFSLCSLKDAKYLQSPTFTTGKLLLTTWCLRLQPNKNEGISIDLRRISSDTSSHYVFAEFSLVNVNHTKCFRHILDDCLYEKSQSWGFDDFVTRKKLFREDRVSLLPNDTLTVLCEMKVNRVDDDTVSTLTVNSEAISPSSSDIAETKFLLADFQQLYEDPVFSDFTIKVGAEELKVHKLVLCARSPVFNTMLNCDMKENITNSLEITDFDPPVVKTMLRYIYCGKVVGMTPETSVQLYSVAEKYNLQGLKEICAQYISVNLSIDNICEVLTLGELHEDEQLRKAARNFICMNASRVQETEKWVGLTKSKPDLVLAMNRIVISQM